MGTVRANGKHMKVPFSLSAPELEVQLQQLLTASRGDLARIWLEHFGHPLPKAIGRKLIERILAYDLQAKFLGGLSKRTHTRLIRMGSERSTPQKRHLSLKPGTLLVREWHAHTHVVEVVENGFSWNGSVHRSLSAIATAITGTRWSGRRFFGL